MNELSCVLSLSLTVSLSLSLVLSYTLPSDINGLMFLFLEIVMLRCSFERLEIEKEMWNSSTGSEFMCPFAIRASAKPPSPVAAINQIWAARAA